MPVHAQRPVSRPSLSRWWACTTAVALLMALIVAAPPVPARASSHIEVTQVTSGLGFPQRLTVFEGHLFFAATTAALGMELWRTDGSSTELVKDIREGSAGSAPNHLTVFADNLFFTAQQDGLGRQLWRTDGTEDGTVVITEMNAGLFGSSPAELAVWDGHLYFNAFDETHGRELWRTNGTAEGVERVADINPGAAWSSPFGFTVFGEVAVLLHDGERGSECDGGKDELRDVLTALPTQLSEKVYVALDKLNKDGLVELGETETDTGRRRMRDSATGRTKRG
jgi:ELWxxDGT repeat protein